MLIEGSLPRTCYGKAHILGDVLSLEASANRSRRGQHANCKRGAGVVFRPVVADGIQMSKSWSKRYFAEELVLGWMTLLCQNGECDGQVKEASC